MIYRRFGFLSSRLLLDQQDKLRLLEEELDATDHNDAATNLHRNFTRNLPEEDLRERQGLLVKIKREYCEYGTSNINPLDFSPLTICSKNPLRSERGDVFQQTSKGRMAECRKPHLEQKANA